MPDSPATVKLAVKVGEAASTLSVSRRTIFRLLALGELRAIKCGRSTRVCAKSVADFVARGGTK